MNDREERRRLVNLGETIALAALIVSALGVWIAWKNGNSDKPTRIVEQRPAVHLALRGTGGDDGRELTIAPADPSHALEGLVVRLSGGRKIEIGSDGRLAASDVQSALGERAKEAKDVPLRVPVRIEARYVESGADRTATGNYILRYKWVGGGLFGSRSIRLLGISRG